MPHDPCHAELARRIDRGRSLRPEDDASLPIFRFTGLPFSLARAAGGFAGPRALPMAAPVPALRRLRHLEVMS
ncbi:MAG: hypothetical protein MI919_18935 [Holophagales bacterium]|nr:hypothetical protein [Holophagales bacterium]